MTASLKGVPSWATVSWTVSSNLLIVGPSNNTTLTYKSNGVSSGTGVISVNVSYGGQNITLSKSATITPSPTPMSTPSVLPSSYNTICSVNKSMNLTGLPALVDSIRWTASGNVGIVTQNEASVTYRRVSNSYSSGILYATVYTPCENKTFSFEISTYSTLSGHGIGIISDCETGLVEMIPTKLVPGSTVTFTTLFPNAANHGITGGEWDFTCGTIISGPTNYWIGTTLRSQITIKVNNNISWPCGEVTVRPISVCDNYLWKIQDTEYGTCSGGGGWSLLSYPNPASDELNIALSYNDDKLIHQKYVLEIVDVTGNVVSRSYIENGKQQIATNNLRPGNYKIIIHANDEIITGSFIINR